MIILHVTNSELSPYCSLKCLSKSQHAGTLLNTDGETFTLYLSPFLPANYFSSDAAGARAYTDFCSRAGMRTVTTGRQPGCLTDCGDCMPLMSITEAPCMLPSGHPGDCDSREPLRWMRTLGWSDFVADSGCYGNSGNNEPEYRGLPLYLETETDARGVTHGRDGNWAQSLHVACGRGHGTTRIGRRVQDSSAHDTNTSQEQIAGASSHKDSLENAQHPNSYYMSYI
eukprot:SAG22_NODE_7194_length_763_cov_3.563253_1_plen_227_part_00